MKKLFFILSVLFITASYSQSEAIERERKFIENIEKKKELKEQEQSNLDLMMQIYNSLNDLQALRKYHCENRHNKEYLKQYKRKLFYGLREEKTWKSDFEKLSKAIVEHIVLYNEHWQRCSSYSWIRKFPRPDKIYDKMEIDNYKRN